jgi:hypothetical protein
LRRLDLDAMPVWGEALARYLAVEAAAARSRS